MARKSKDDVLSDLMADAKSVHASHDTSTQARRRGKVISVSMPEADVEFIKAAAASHGLSVSAYLRFVAHAYEERR